MLFKYTINQAGSQTTKFFPAKLVAMFAEPTKKVNASTLYPSYVLVQDIDLPTPIKIS